MNKLISHQQITILFGVAGVLFFGLTTGCFKAPDDFPDVVPCIVTVTDNNTPVEGVFVQIETVPRTNSLSVVAQTNSQGNAVIQTQLGTFAKPGVPTGKLVMVLTKIPDVPAFKTKEELEKMSDDQLRAYGTEMQARRSKIPPIIPSELTDTQHSPLTIDAVSGNPVKWNVALEEYRGK
jgi:hypothetical protein